MGNLHFPVKPGDFFLPLDNSAVFMASVTGRDTPFVFRVSCELDEPIQLDALELAFAGAVKRFPFLTMELRPGLFWYYLEPLGKPCRLQADSRYPVEYHHLGRSDRHLFRVRVYGSRIACEFHHLLTDGTGAVEFLRMLVACYLTERGVVCEDWQGIKNPVEPYDPREYEDAYAHLVRKGVPEPDPLPPAAKLPGRRYRDGTYRVTTGSLSVACALAAARSRGVTLTELLAAVHLYAFQAVLTEAVSAAGGVNGRTSSRRGGTRLAPVCVQIPVNMRKFYPSPSMRNFFLFVPLTLDLRLGTYGFDELLERVRYQLKLGLDRREFDRQIVRNVGSEQKFIARVVPLAIKNIALRLIGAKVADRPFSGSLSNIQTVSMPAPFAAHIRRFDFVPSRNAVTGANIGVISWQDTLAVTVGSLIEDRSFERHFFTQCVALGIPVKIESNI
jgi:hypothetical protein